MIAENNLSYESTEKEKENYGIDILKDPQIHRIIVDLQSIIDRFYDDSKRLDERILELAKKLDESNICKRNEICQKIKEILKDKISQGKITERWIEKCLPEDYKRQYERVKKPVKRVSNESELNSLSKEINSQKIEILVTTDGSQLCNDNDHLEKEIQSTSNNSDGPENNKNISENNYQNIQTNECASCLDLKNQVKDLEEIILKNSCITKAYDLKNLDLMVPKIWKQRFVESFDRCKDHITIVFNKQKKKIECIQPDITLDNTIKTSDCRIGPNIDSTQDSDGRSTTDDNDTLQGEDDSYE